MPARSSPRCRRRGSESSTSRPARPTSRTFSSTSPEPPVRMAEHNYDVVVIGSGAAGLSAALNLAGELRGAVLAKSDISAGSTALAPGGVAAVLEAGGTIPRHIHGAD